MYKTIQNLASHKKITRKKLSTTKFPKKMPSITPVPPPRPRPICEASLSWILNYRRIPKSKTIDQVQNEDGHSGGSWGWTTSQSKLIDQMGWDRWFNQTKGPLGYGTYLEEIWPK